jgi:hypothetical protein
MNTFTRWYLGVLLEVVVIALTGSLIGPVIGGTFGYAWGYYSGIAGPIAVVMIAGAVLPLAHWHRLV